MFELIDLCPRMLLEQSGQRSMWAEVRQLMSDAEKAALLSGGGQGNSLEIRDLPATRYAPAAIPEEAPARGEATTTTQTSSRSGEGGMAPSQAVPSESSATGGAIEAIVGYREFKGNEQWRVRWAGCGAESDTWETSKLADVLACSPSKYDLLNTLLIPCLWAEEVVAAEGMGTAADAEKLQHRGA